MQAPNSPIVNVPVPPLPPKPPMDTRTFVLQILALVALTAITFQFGAAALIYTVPGILALFGANMGAAQIRGRLLPPGHLVVPPGFSVQPPPPASPTPPYRAPLASHTGFENEPEPVAAKTPTDVEAIYAEAIEPVTKSSDDIPPTRRETPEKKP